MQLDGLRTLGTSEFPSVSARMPAILAITHQLQMAKVADQVLVLQDGTVKDVGLAACLGCHLGVSGREHGEECG